MSNTGAMEQKQYQHEEYTAHHSSGMTMLLLNTFLMLASTGGIIGGAIGTASNRAVAFYVLLIVVSTVYLCIIGPILYGGLKILKPNEALVLTLFGKYVGTLKGEGFFYVNPFVSAVNPASDAARTAAAADAAKATAKAGEGSAYVSTPLPGKKISLKAMTLNNEKQKINDRMGNPIVIGMVQMALNKLNENQVVILDDERKAAMVSNLLVVLCGNRDAQPVVNSGSLY